MWKTISLDLLGPWSDARALFAERPLVSAGITVLILLHTLAWCRILAKSGHSSALGLFTLFPPLAIAFPFVLAFTRSPAERELRALRGMQKVIRKTDRRLERAA